MPVPTIIGQPKIHVPTIYIWEDPLAGTVTGAFKWKGMNFGQSYEIHENPVRHKMHRKQLLAVVTETLDVIIHHGDRVLDSSGNIDPIKVNDEEALRYYHDPLWGERLKAFQKVLKIQAITKSEAVKLQLLDAPKEASFLDNKNL